jgi:hypothetical protein
VTLLEDTAWTVNHVINRLGRPGTTPLPAPAYTAHGSTGRPRVGLAVHSMRDHTSDEGWQLFKGLRDAGYMLCGHGMQPHSLLKDQTDIRRILEVLNPAVVFVQDQREWEGRTAGPGFDPREGFRNVHALASRPDVFRVGVLKDAHQQPDYHRASFESFGAHAVVCYYHPRVVAHLAPHVRHEHLIRTRHTLDPAHLPPWKSKGDRLGAVVSGALSGAYPLRKRVTDDALLLKVHVLKHPGYHRRGCHTPHYLRALSSFKVSVCTSSIYGYALRKVVESTAVGCRVLTDLPEDEVMPGGIDGNLTRVRPDTPSRKVGEIIHDLLNSYDEDLQKAFAEDCAAYYDFRASGERLAGDIETMRRAYR